MTGDGHGEMRRSQGGGQGRDGDGTQKDREASDKNRPWSWTLHLAYCNMCILSLRFTIYIQPIKVIVLAARFHCVAYFNELRLSKEPDKVVQLGYITLGIHCC